SWQELVVHRDVADTVDSILRGKVVTAEERTRDEETGRVTVRRISAGGMDVPTWGVGGFGGNTFERPERPSRSERSERRNGGWTPLRQVDQQGFRGGNGGNGSGAGFRRSSAQAELRTLAPTGTAPAEFEHRVVPATLISTGRTALAEGVYAPEEAQDRLPMLKTLRMYPFGVNRDRLAEAARQLNVPIILTNNQGDADAIITLKNYYHHQPERLQEAEKDRKLIIILKNNTVAQMQHALAHIFDIPEREDEDDDVNDVNDGFRTADDETDDSTKRAMLETEDAIHQVLNKGLTTAELAPANAYVRRLQHQLATRYNLNSRSRGKEPYRRVKIFRARD
ncbi:MAG: AAA family ATPase, partial [Chloroflexota bacterium]|nr:AAA family ATPase [Chloroflexota bacterium]